MEQEDRELLRKTLDLAQKNNKMLMSIQRSMFWGKVTRWVYYGIIIAVSIGAYYFVQPYIDQLLGVYGGFKGDVQNVTGFFN